ncbi:MAG: glycosyl hydrolase family 18 protein [Syntrophothermus sp.]
MKKLILLLISAAMCINIYAGGKLVVGYYNYDNARYPHTVIDYSSLTHICHAFIWPLADGSISYSSTLALYPDMISAAHKNGVKVLVSIGGYGTASQNTGFKSMVGNAASRAAFVTNLVNFIKTYQYDGADFDWEYPRSDDRANFTSLLTDIRAAFKTNNIPLLTAAVPSADYGGGYDIPKLAGILDWIGIMTYDFIGPWDAVGTSIYHNSALYGSSKQAYSIEKSVAAWTGYGMPKSRILIGTPFYGYLLNAPDIFAAKTSTSGEISVSYANIEQNYLTNQNWEYNFDNTTKNPYLRNKTHTQILTFDDTVSVRMKCQYVNAQGLGGTIIWKIAQGYNGFDNPLLSTVGDNLLRNVTYAASVKTYPNIFAISNFPNPFNPDTMIRYSIPSLDGNGKTLRVKIKVYDMLGRTVKALLDEDKKPGTYEVNFNAGRLSSGIYLCSIEAGHLRTVHKMLLSR